MAALVIGFIGFGEAGHAIAKGLRGAGVESLFAYDINTTHPRLGAQIQGRATDAAVGLVGSVPDLAAASDIILSTVVASAAVEVAAGAAPSLSERHFYADLNSVSPAAKQAVSRHIAGSGAKFVEAAVMAPVAPKLHRTPMLLAGDHAAAFVEILAPYGMQLEVLGTQIGSASAIKMFRSILVKGLEALVLECLIGASRHGVAERVLASMGETFPGLDWNRLAHYLVGRAVLHGERRASEMKEVGAMLRSMNIEPIMSDAAARRLGWCADLALVDRLAGDDYENYHLVMRAMSDLMNT